MPSSMAFLLLVGAGFDLDTGSRLDRSAREDAGKYPFPGHDAIPCLLEDGASVMADLADLTDLETRSAADAEDRPDGKRDGDRSRRS